MKIGLPKIRFSRKMLLISVGMLAVLAGSGAAALYVGAGDTLLKSEAEHSPIGGACTTVQLTVLKTPSKRLWLRKFIRMEHADGPERIKTALRVAGLLAKANQVDLIQVSVLDATGPTMRSQMRGRAIGAEVVIALKPQYLPDMKEPFIVRYYEGMPSNEGIYYGERVSLEVPEIQKLVKAMRSVPNKADCTEPEKPADAAAKNDHGAKPKNDHGAKPKHGEPVVKEAEHGEKPAAHGEEPAKQEHEAKAKEGANSEGHAPAAAEEPSFLDSVLSMVGLGGAEEKPAESHEAKTEDDGAAVTDYAIDPAPAAEDHASEPAEKHEAVPTETDADADKHQPVKAKETSDKHAEDESLKGENHGAPKETH